MEHNSKYNDEQDGLIKDLTNLLIKVVAFGVSEEQRQEIERAIERVRRYSERRSDADLDS